MPTLSNYEKASEVTEGTNINLQMAQLWSLELGHVNFRTVRHAVDWYINSLSHLQTVPQHGPVDAMFIDECIEALGEILIVALIKFRWKKAKASMHQIAQASDIYVRRQGEPISAETLEAIKSKVRDPPRWDKPFNADKKP